MEDHEDRQREVADLITFGYMALAKTLGLLPIPIALPPAIRPDWTGTDAANALIRSHDLVMDVPGIADETKVLIAQMIMDWLTAHTFGTLDYLQPAVWRLNTAEYAIARLSAQLEVVADQLTGNPREPDDGTE